MPESIGHFSPIEVIEAIEENLVDSSAVLSHFADGVVFRGSDVTWVYTGGLAISRVLGARFTTEDAEARVSQILSYFKEWDAPVSWVVGPSSYPPMLGDYLHASGFGICETWMGMAMNLSELRNVQSPDGLKIEEVCDEAGLGTWGSLWSDSIGEQLGRTANLFSQCAVHSDTRCRYYLGHMNGKPISRAMSFRRDDVVGLYWMTPSGSIGPNIGAAMAYQAMVDAAASGAKTAVLTVSSGAQSCCEQLGFKPYCQFNIYNWPAPSNQNPVC